MHPTFDTQSSQQYILNNSLYTQSAQSKTYDSGGLAVKDGVALPGPDEPAAAPVAHGADNLLVRGGAVVPGGTGAVGVRGGGGANVPSQRLAARQRMRKSASARYINPWHNLTATNISNRAYAAL